MSSHQFINKIPKIMVFKNKFKLNFLNLFKFIHVNLIQ